ncbi:MAG TPA: GDSL-type esterase/lipase family protein [Actinomycetota bacterium]
MKHVVCYGDSNTWGWDAATEGRHPWPVRWTGVLQERLGSGVRVHEEGLNGRTTMHPVPDEPARDGLASLPMLLETHTPIDVLVIALGVNDLFVPGLTARWAARGIAALAEAALASGAGPMTGPPGLLAVIPPPIRHPLRADWDADAPGARAASIGLAAAVVEALAPLDVPWLDLDGIADVDPLDGLHFDAAAHAAIGVAVAEAVRPLLYGSGHRAGGLHPEP